MYLPKNINLSTHSINNIYMPWLISFVVDTILILIVLVIVIILCSLKKKQKLILIKSSNHVEASIFTVNGSRVSFDKMKNDYKNNKSESVCDNHETDKKTSCFVTLCCCFCPDYGSKYRADEGLELLQPSKCVLKVDLRDKDRRVSTDHVNIPNHDSIPDLIAAASDGMSEHETGRISHIDRELPPIPKASVTELKTANFNESIVEPEIVSMSESENYNELKQTDETDTEQQNFTSLNNPNLSIEQLESNSSSPSKFSKFPRSSIECTTCCCGSHQDILSSDDLSSNDYDPTYAAIKRKKPSCPVCGVPSVYTPANSNRNSNLSLQFNSCLTSPIRNVNLKPAICDSLNNSTYASIAKLPKIIPENNLNKDQDNSGSSTIKRQRSISQGDIIRSSIMKNLEIQRSENAMKDTKSEDVNNQKKDFIKNHSIFNNTISLWSLMASNRNSPYSMFPIIPERTYGQSVVDLIEKLRESEQSEKLSKHSYFGINNTERSFTPPILFNNSFKKSGSILNSRSRVWTPPSCQMVHGNVVNKSGICSPLKLFDRNLNSYDFNFPDLIGSYRKGNPSFQPTLTPPLSPMDCLNADKEETFELVMSESTKQTSPLTNLISNSELNSNDISNNGLLFQASSVYEDLDYDSGTAADKEIEVINNETNIIVKETDDYDYLQSLDQTEINGEIKLLKYSDNGTNVRSRPISIHLYGDESLIKEKSLNYRLDKCEIFGFSSVQMSPLMEQSIENSSSKTTLSSLSFHQFHRLISSEDSCAKSPPSAELSPSLDNFEISPDTGAFIYNDLMWSKLNSAFDDYDTFE